MQLLGNRQGCQCYQGAFYSFLIVFKLFLLNGKNSFWSNRPVYGPVYGWTDCLLSSARGTPHRHTSKEQLKSEHTQDSEHTLNFVSFSLAQFFTRFQSAEKASFDGQVLTSKARMMSESSSLTQTYLHSKHFSPERTAFTSSSRYQLKSLNSLYSLETYVCHFGQSNLAYKCAS